MNKLKSLFMPAPVQSAYADAGDFMRVASVGLVGWFHIWQQSWLNPNLNVAGHTLDIYPLVACGYMFVDLMLLLSGFLLMLGWLSGRSRDLRAFYTGRAARILPSYLLCMLVMLFVFAIPGKLHANPEHFWTDVLGHLSFTHNLFEYSYRYTQLNGALWTLAVEMQFYLIFPLLARIFEKRPLATYIPMVLFGFLVRAIVYGFFRDPTIYFNRLSAMMDVYANGMLAACIYHKLASRPQRAWQAWLSTLLAAFSMVVIYHVVDIQFTQLRNDPGTQYGQMLLRFPLTLAGSVFLVCGSRAVHAVRMAFSNRFVRFLSALSFNFYIWHQFLAVKLKAWRIPHYEGENPNQAGLQPWQWQYTACCFLGALLLSLIITYAVEKPCAKLIKRRLSRKYT